MWLFAPKISWGGPHFPMFCISPQFAGICVPSPPIWGGGAAPLPPPDFGGPGRNSHLSPHNLVHSGGFPISPEIWGVRGHCPTSPPVGVGGGEHGGRHTSSLILGGLWVVSPFPYMFGAPWGGVLLPLQFRVVYGVVFPFPTIWGWGKGRVFLFPSSFGRGLALTSS